MSRETGVGLQGGQAELGECCQLLPVWGQGRELGLGEAIPCPMQPDRVGAQHSVMPPALAP